MSVVGGSTGQKVRGILEVPGIDVELAYTDVRGVDDGPTVLLTGGMHGGEYPGIAAAIETARRLDPTQVSGRVFVIHLTNPPAFWDRRMYLNPLDGKNLGRCFPGDPQGSASERMAAVVFGVARQANCWMDLHGGDIHEALVPFSIFSSLGGSELVAAARHLCEIYGIPRVVPSGLPQGQPTVSFDVAAASLGIPAILAESGGVGQIDDASVERHLVGVENVLRHLGVLSGAPAPHGPQVVYSAEERVRSEVQGFWRCLVRPGDTVRAGDPAGVLKDVYGDTLREVAIPRDGEVLYTATSYAIGVGDPLFSVAVP